MSLMPAKAEIPLATDGHGVVRVGGTRVEPMLVIGESTGPASKERGRSNGIRPFDVRNPEPLALLWQVRLF